MCTRVSRPSAALMRARPPQMSVFVCVRRAHGCSGAQGQHRTPRCAGDGAGGGEVVRRPVAPTVNAAFSSTVVPAGADIESAEVVAPNRPPTGRARWRDVVQTYAAADAERLQRIISSLARCLLPARCELDIFILSARMILSNVLYT